MVGVACLKSSILIFLVLPLPFESEPLLPVWTGAEEGATGTERLLLALGVVIEVVVLETEFLLRRGGEVATSETEALLPREGGREVSTLDTEPLLPRDGGGEEVESDTEFLLLEGGGEIGWLRLPLVDFCEVGERGKFMFDTEFLLPAS